MAFAGAAPALAAPTTPASKPAILIASDSTAANAPAERFPQTGWGTMLPCGLVPGVAVRNHAMGGRSTRTFLSEGRWDKLMAEIRPGDTVLIQFGHNDADRNKPERFARAWTDYRENLLRMVWMARGAKATPILLTPVARRSFTDSGKVAMDFAEYSDVVREVAQKTGTPLIDLEAISRDWVGKAGLEGSKPWYMHLTAADHNANFPNGIDDNTHFSELGARGVANLVAGALKDLNLPVSAEVLAERPDLTRTTALGSNQCH